MMLIEGNIWGHPDARRIAFTAFDAYLRTELRFRPLPLSRYLYYREEPNSHPTVLSLTVDDIVIANTDDVVRPICSAFHRQWGTKGPKLDRDILGCRIDHLPNGDIALSQPAGINRLLTSRSAWTTRTRRPRPSQPASPQTPATPLRVRSLANSPKPSASTSSGTSPGNRPLAPTSSMPIRC